MKYPDYHNVEVAYNGAHNRNNITHIGAVKNFSGHRETYMTYFRYNDEMIDHFQDKQTVSGYKGSAYADWLPIDVDSDSLDEAQDNMRALMINLEDYNIDTSCCRFYFSGSKGFHVMIPSGVFGAKPDPQNDKRFKKVASLLTEGVQTDMSIYQKTRIFRLPNTINGKTGLYKIELYPFQITNDSISGILDAARQPGERLEIDTEYDESEELKEAYDAPIQANQTKPNTGKPETYICMSTMMKGVPDGERDNVGVRVSSHLKKHGLNAEMSWVAMDEWNKKNDPPMETDRLETVYQQGMKYEFGCHDFLLAKYCDPDCKFYKSHWGRF
ncbi:primase C-terminal domain-containing protein [Natribacillus halophilus]|uniref:Primase C-terminal 1 domain-containing protein n=1 Tax=Natribacillus halophilus TaxID=549003 RepID=A0A1G8RUE5_9BACI|nr:hypothetical protein [Natribacillus halophilus]SDJ20582.1 hypothetical protein SAMN04488123_12053 [Natribacillus halophilus]